MFFPKNFSGAPPRGPGGPGTSESALTHAQLRASGWMPRRAPPRMVPGAGHPGFGKVKVPQVVMRGLRFERPQAKPPQKSLPKVSSAPQRTRAHTPPPTHTTLPLSLKSREVPAHVDNPRLAYTPFPRSHMLTHPHSHAITGNRSEYKPSGTPGMLNTGAHAQAIPSITRHSVMAFVTLLRFQTLTHASTGIHTTRPTFTTSHPLADLATLIYNHTPPP